MLGPDQMHHMTRISDALRAGQDGTSGVHRGGAAALRQSVGGAGGRGGG